MKTLRGIQLSGYGPFRKEQAVELRDESYAVVARHEDDAERSNGVGKSTLLSAVRFVLHGEHSWRVDDEMISWGQDRARVELAFDDGSSASREKVRGKPVQVRFSRNGEPQLSQAAAEEAIEKAIGLDKDDFLGACVLEQKRISKFVDLESSDLLAFLSSWFRLDRLDEAQAKSSEGAAALQQERERAESHLAAALSILDAALASRDGKEGDTIEWFREEASRTEARASDLEALRVEAEASFETVAARRRAWLDAEKLRRIVDEGQALAGVEGPNWEDLNVVHRKAFDAQANSIAARDAAGDRARAALRVVAGGFDGQCPVVGAPCPARAQVDGMRAEAREKAEAEEKLAGAAEAALKEARERTLRTANELAEAKNRAEKLEFLRGERDVLLPSAREAPDEEPKVEKEAEELGAVRQALGEARAALGALRERVARAERAEANVEAARGKIEALDARLKVVRAGGVVLRETTRRVAEGRMREIARRATEAISRAGLPLEISARWERETSDLAHACRACGAPFPRGRAVKECPCGEARGKHVERKPAFVPSRKSGGLDDLAGIFLQLAVGAWIRRERGSEFSLALVDEGTAHMDRSLRKTTAQTFSGALVHFEIRQALFVSHDASTLESLPGRIEVVSGRDGFATARVIG